jgi:4-hydroxy-tetrahydrodipicolinate synthase
MIGAAAAATVVGGPAKAAQILGSSSKTLLWVASLTPCDKNLKFDPGAMKDQLAWFKSQGADGITLLGSTGEYPSFSVAERKQVMEVVAKNKNGLNIMVSTGTPNFPETLELSRHAADHGADSLLVIPPFYFKKPAPEGILRYYTMLFEALPSSLAINLYHYTGMSGVPITIDLLKALHQYPNLAGIKDSQGDMEEYKVFVQSFPDLNMRTGTGNKLEYALQNGMGAILADSNVFTKEYADVFKAFHAGQDYAAPLAKLRAQEKIMRDGNLFNFGPMKYALSLRMGGKQTYPRPPFPDVTDAEKEAIKRGFDQIREMNAG